MKLFRSTERKGFQITFENGITVSVQWGKTNYCDNKVINLDPYTCDIEFDTFDNDKDMESVTAEVAFFYNNTMIKPSFILEDDIATSVLGYLTPEEVLDVMIKARNFDISKLKKT